MLADRLTYRSLVFTGLALVLFGFGVPFLMCIQVIAPTFFLCFLAFAASVTGVLLGIAGSAWRGERRLR